MSTTTPPTFVGTPILDDKRVQAIKDLLVEALGNMDKASEVEDSFFYTGAAEAYEYVLKLLYHGDVEGPKAEDGRMHHVGDECGAVHYIDVSDRLRCGRDFMAGTICSLPAGHLGPDASHYY